MKQTRTNGNRPRRTVPRSMGFTLLELLVAMTILAIMGAALFTAFSQSTRTWQRADARTRQFVAAREALDVMATEIREAIVDPDANGPPNDGACFYGVRDTHVTTEYVPGHSYQDAIYFVAPTSMRPADARQDICVIGYWLDGRQLMRYCLADRDENDQPQTNWSSLPLPVGGTDSHPLGVDVYSLTFEFWSPGNDWEFQDPDRHEWLTPHALPRAVRITLVVWDPTLPANATQLEITKRCKTFTTVVHLDNAQ